MEGGKGRKERGLGEKEEKNKWKEVEFASTSEQFVWFDGHSSSYILHLFKSICIFTYKFGFVKKLGNILMLETYLKR